MKEDGYEHDVSSSVVRVQQFVTARPPPAPMRDSVQQMGKVVCTHELKTHNAGALRDTLSYSFSQPLLVFATREPCARASRWSLATSRYTSASAQCVAARSGVAATIRCGSTNGAQLLAS